MIVYHRRKFVYEFCNIIICFHIPFFSILPILRGCLSTPRHWPRDMHISRSCHLQLPASPKFKIIFWIYVFMLVKSHRNATAALLGLRILPLVYIPDFFLIYRRSIRLISFLLLCSLPLVIAAFGISSAPDAPLVSPADFKGWQPLQRVPAISEDPTL